MNSSKLGRLILVEVHQDPAMLTNVRFSWFSKNAKLSLVDIGET
jgi:hypothetical protein